MYHALICDCRQPRIERRTDEKKKRRATKEEKDRWLADEAQQLCAGNLTELACLLTGIASLLPYVLPYTNTAKCFLFNDTSLSPRVYRETKHERRSRTTRTPDSILPCALVNLFYDNKRYYPSNRTIVPEPHTIHVTFYLISTSYFLRFSL